MTTKNNIDCRFVNYTGKYPNLCRGILTLSINGINRTFGMYDDCDYDKFWFSGGSTGFRNGYSDSYIKKGDWGIDEYRLPDELRPFATLLIDLFNDNVPKGCCGGCL